MPRPRKRRFCRRYDANRVYKPQGIPFRDIGTAVIELDQFEAMRLCDLEGVDQEEAGRRMNISRGTVQRLLSAGRRTLLAAVLRNDAILVSLKESEDSDVSLHPQQPRYRSGRRRM